PYNVRLNVSTCGSSFNGNGNVNLILYTNACGGNPVTWVNGGGPFGCGGDGGVSFSASSNTTYYILASGNYGNSGTLDITATLSIPPTNDDCANPITLTNGVPYVETNFNATEFGEPSTDPSGSPISHGVWFAITTPPYNVRLNLSTCGSSFNGNGNVNLILYTNACGGNPVTWVNGGGPFGCGSDGGVSFSAFSNTTYYILASGNYGNSGTLDITATLSTPPANDDCANPITLTNGVSYVENNFNATEFGDPTFDPSGSPIGRGVWFTLTAFSGQQVTISTCGSSYNGNGNVDLILYTNACGGNAVAWANGSTPFGCGGDAGLSFSNTANRTYYILASGNYGNWGTLKITANTPPPTNDICSEAMTMTAGLTYTTNTLYATSIGDPSPMYVPGFGRGVWYEYTPTVTGLVGVTTAGSSFQTALAVYAGGCGSPTEIAWSQSSGAYNDSGYADVNFTGVAGTPYLILAGGVNGQAGTLQMLIPNADLVSSNFTATNPAGGLLTAGRSFSAGWTVQNQGSNSINGAWTDSLSLTNASTNIVIASLNRQHTAPSGGSYTETYANLMPPVAAGNYTLVATADAVGDVAEVTKTNNIQLLSVTITNLPPTVTLLLPTNQIDLVSCVQLPIRLAAQVQPGSYSITNVLFYDSNSTNMIGSTTNSPYRTTSIALGFGTNLIGVMALDSFGLVGFSTNLATVTIHYPTNLNVLRGQFATNGDYVGCMCAYSGSNYLVLTTTNLALPGPSWPPYVTNQPIINVLAFTNQPTAPHRFFRVKLVP
ncbi:MAG TPA: CARDB domain-containing protein, partial [Verrucomicrobiae bacterium]|nr:CARDB domain-containing protein [Verrucomicrobiae bacterium]